MRHAARAEQEARRTCFDDVCPQDRLQPHGQRCHGDLGKPSFLCMLAQVPAPLRRQKANVPILQRSMWRAHLYDMLVVSCADVEVHHTSCHPRLFGSALHIRSLMPRFTADLDLLHLERHGGGAVNTRLQLHRTARASEHDIAMFLPSLENGSIARMKGCQRDCWE